MNISEKTWISYRDKHSQINKTAETEFVTWLNSQGGWDAVERTQVIDYAYGLSTKYGEASAALSAMMYEETAALSKVTIPTAEVAETAAYQEVAKAINGAAKKSTNSDYLGGVVNKLVKQTGADTTLKNAKRDGAEFAWIPAGETCPFCLSLAAIGWKKASSKSVGKADHIHNNCDCAFAVRFDSNSTIGGYDPNKYKTMFDNAEGSTTQEKINSMRRVQTQESKEGKKVQKKITYTSKTSFNKNGDPVYKIYGPIINSHPNEMDRIIKSAEEKGVEIIEGNGNRMAYSPGLKAGKPGQLIVSKNNSIGAWLHEEQHMNEDYNDGFPGFAGLFDIERRSRMEYNAYKKEIEIAEKANRQDIVEELKKLCKIEIEKIGGVWDETKLN